METIRLLILLAETLPPHPRAAGPRRASRSPRAFSLLHSPCFVVLESRDPFPSISSLEQHAGQPVIPAPFLANEQQGIDSGRASRAAAEQRFNDLSELFGGASSSLGDSLDLWQSRGTEITRSRASTVEFLGFPSFPAERKFPEAGRRSSCSVFPRETIQPGPPTAVKTAVSFFLASEHGERSCLLFAGPRI